MSDEEKESFEITDKDLEAEFDPSRFRKNLTKNQQIYGVWADSDEEDNRPGPSSSRNSFSGGVAFVSAGIHKPIQKKEESEGKENEKEELGVRDEYSDESSEEEIQIIKKEKTGHIPFEQMAGMRKKGGMSSSGGGGGLAMYGIGAKLALKMGFQPGKGLGKELQGISAPIEAFKRKGRGAIGAYGKESKQKVAELTIAVEESKAKLKEQKWQKTNKNKGTKVQYEIRTAEEILEQKQFTIRPDAGQLAKVKVIDMTGPQERVLSGYHAISGQQRPRDEWELMEKELAETRNIIPQTKSNFEMKELIHNIKILTDSCEQDIHRSKRKHTYAADRQVTIKDEQIKLKEKVEKERNLIDNLESLLTDLTELVGDSQLDLDRAFITLSRISREHEEEWDLYDIFNIVAPIVIPMLKAKLRIWNPLDSPLMPINLYSEWASLLYGKNEQYELIMWETWVPTIRSATTYWNVKEPDPMLNLLAVWRDLLPGWIMANMLEQLVFPKISNAVEEWDPLSDPIPIHAWILPWIPLLGTKLETVYPTIRRKLSNALIKWHPSDSSGKQILTPWINVFTPGAMDAFILKNIVPKLNICMGELIINPHNQDLGPWNSVLDWLDMVPISVIVNIFENVFFPKWTQFLIGWLMQRPNFEEVYKWYTFWRNLFPSNLIQETLITENIQKALEIITRAVQCAGSPLEMGYLMGPVIQQIPQEPPPHLQQQQRQEFMADALRMTAQVPHGFRDLVQMKCEELGLIFLPLPNRYYEGKQVYRCGNILVYISASVIFIQREGLWAPVSLNQLIQAATS